MPKHKAGSALGLSVRLPRFVLILAFCRSDWAGLDTAAEFPAR